ncbi:hypothetical protein CPB84DRAFT_1846759 [Gymnopilus junonius]|uniref:Uncharacterized protein n=1 Tax=Gymnopilus junonius TaxID=109634 RepID=A0A9P5TNR6_GYMJU|nr:hypothetical protein CPB84DRAFT_1846759 [Gymnopilus junonius]
MSSETEAAHKESSNNSSLGGGKVAEGEQTNLGETDTNQNPTTGSGSYKDSTTGSGNQETGAETRTGVTSSSQGASAQPKPDDEEEEEEEEEESSDDDVPQFKWGAARGPVTSNVKGQQPRPKPHK